MSKIEKTMMILSDLWEFYVRLQARNIDPKSSTNNDSIDTLSG